MLCRRLPLNHPKPCSQAINWVCHMQLLLLQTPTSCSCSLQGKCGPGMTQRNAVRSAAMCLPRIHASQLHSQLYRLQDLTDFSHLKHKISKFAFESPRVFWCACCSPVHCGASWVQTSIIFFSNAITKTPRTSSLTASTREHNQLSCPLIPDSQHRQHERVVRDFDKAFDKFYVLQYHV